MTASVPRGVNRKRLRLGFHPSSVVGADVPCGSLRHGCGGEVIFGHSLGADLVDPTLFVVLEHGLLMDPDLDDGVACLNSFTATTLACLLEPHNNGALFYAECKVSALD